MSTYDPATTRPCLHPIKQEIPPEVPTDYHHICFCCNALGLLRGPDGERIQYFFADQSDPELGG